MGFIQGEGRTQGTLFAVVLDDLVPNDHVCRVIDAFVARLGMNELGFECSGQAVVFYPRYWNSTGCWPHLFCVRAIAE